MTLFRKSRSRRVKAFMRSRFPFLVPIFRPVYFLWWRAFLLTRSRKQVFAEMLEKNKWKDTDSLSGPGSNLVQTRIVRRALPLLIQELNCRSLLDVPCGDFFWMKLVEMNIVYIGGDIIDELITENKREYGSNTRRFINIDMLQDKLPKVDLVLCRDCLIHFSYKHIFQALHNIKSSGSTYLLTTTFVSRRRNKDILTGGWRPINLQLPPFSFPSPMKLIDEQCPLDDHGDKSLGLWRINDIPEFRKFHDK